jgi:transcriptional regulator with XRE-family HTH domain
MSDKPRGRPPKPLDPAASHAARLGAEIRERRLAKGLTQQALGDLIGCSAQQVSTVEHATSPVSGRFAHACDAALDAQAAAQDLLPVVLFERATQREERAAARRVDPTSRRARASHHAVGDGRTRATQATRSSKPSACAYRAERRAHHLLDVARAHGQRCQDTQAVQLVLGAEKLAPEEVRLLPATRELIADILHRAPVVRSELRDLADRLTAA